MIKSDPIIYITENKWDRDHNHDYFAIYSSKNGWQAIKHGNSKGGPKNKKAQT